MPDISSSAALLRSPERENSKDSDSLNADDFQEKNYRESNSRFRHPSRTTLLVHLAFVSLYTTIFLVALTKLYRHSSPPPCADTLQPTSLCAGLTLIVWTTDYSLEKKPVLGPPIAAINAQWMSLLNSTHEARLSSIAMSLAHLISMQYAHGLHKSTARTIAHHLLHRLHCLYTIYKCAQPQYYGAERLAPPPAWASKHRDYYIDNLHQFVQRHNSTDVSTFKWRQGRKLPWLVLSARETCMDWGVFDG